MAGVLDGPCALVQVSHPAVMDVIATPSASPAPGSGRLEALIADIEPARVALAGHGIYAALRTPAHLRTFLEHHVFAVWDFMSLVKTLQLALTCTRVPWVPRGDPQLRRFVHEIVLGEESDIDARGEVSSHFEVYVRAMRSCGADTGPITRFVKAVSAGALVDQALDDAGAPPAAARFVRHTFSVLAVGAVHEVAASFTFAREDVIPVMFRQFVDDLRARFPGGYDDLAWYLDRHVAVAEVIRGARQVPRIVAGDMQHLFRRRDHFDHPAVVRHQQVAAAQQVAARQDQCNLFPRNELRAQAALLAQVERQLQLPLGLDDVGAGDHLQFLAYFKHSRAA